MAQSTRPPLAITAAARVLGLSESHVRTLDHILHPIRDSNGRRLYDPDIIDQVAGERAARQALDAPIDREALLAQLKENDDGE